MGAKQFKRKFSRKNVPAKGWQSLAVMLAPRRCPIRLGSARPQPISNMRCPITIGCKAMRWASHAPEGHSKPNKGHMAEEMPKRRAVPFGS